MYRRLPLCLLLLAIPAPLAAQNPSESPTYETVELEYGFFPDPHEVELTAGGGSAVDVGECAYGYVATAPDLDLVYQAESATRLYIHVRSDEDTMLLVNDPSGRWLCDDDALGDLNPLVTIENPESGMYNIWVGTYGEEAVPATLSITEIAPR